MKKWLKILLIILVIIIFLIVVDLVSIFTNNKPIFAIRKNDNVYRGIFYDTYNCQEFAVPQIKLKGTKFSCTIEGIDSYNTIKIVDKTLNINNFSCAEALEQFYEDDSYIYYWNCLKNEYMVVEYNDGNEELISTALEKGIITINDLDNYNIKYYKVEK